MKKTIMILVLCMYHYFCCAQNINIQTISENEYHSLRNKYVALALDTLLFVKEESDYISLPLDNDGSLGFSFWGNAFFFPNVLKLTVVMVAQLCESTDSL